MPLQVAVTVAPCGALVTDTSSVAASAAAATRTTAANNNAFTLRALIGPPQPEYRRGRSPRVFERLRKREVIYLGDIPVAEYRRGRSPRVFERLPDRSRL